MFAGVDQSIRRSTRKPRLNQDDNKWWKSRSVLLSSGWLEQFLSARFGGEVQCRGPVVRGFGLPGLQGLLEALGVHTEAGRQGLEEAQPLRLVERRVAPPRHGG
jgi:hypothetical protein